MTVEERAEAFKLAHRHSRRVKILKFALPVSAFLMIAVIYLAVQADNFVPEGLEFGSIEVESGKLVMVDPVMNGFTKDQKPYTVTAKRALQDIKKPNIVELQQLSAVIPFSEGSQATMNAKAGIMDNDTNVMQFSEGIEIVTDDGMTAQFQSATIQIADGSMQTSDPVEINREGFNIIADRLKVENNGDTMRFEQSVRVIIDPKSVRRP